VLSIVRDMIEAETAVAIMGNHELNAIHYHSLHPRTGEPLRARTRKNTHQHARFLEEFPIDAARTRDAIAWMRSLPFFIETEHFRAVHACWDDGAIETLAAASPDGVLKEDHFIRAADRNDPLRAATEIITKGPELALPEGHFILDKDGNERREIRVKWWAAEASHWRDIALSVPDPDALPEGPLPEDLRPSTYPADARPVFFGHYWLTGAPQLQAPNALCLDYSAGTDGPLVSYRFEEGSGGITLAGIEGQARKNSLQTGGPYVPDVVRMLALIGAVSRTHPVQPEAPETSLHRWHGQRAWGRCLRLRE
jgi:hypothetical protein